MSKKYIEEYACGGRVDDATPEQLAAIDKSANDELIKRLTAIVELARAGYIEWFQACYRMRDGAHAVSGNLNEGFLCGHCIPQQVVGNMIEFAEAMVNTTNRLADEKRVITPEEAQKAKLKGVH